MTRHQWTQSEDATLKRLVAQYGDKRGPQGKWGEISSSIPGRTKKDCRKRWFHSLDPSVRKGRWTKDEDSILLQHYNKLGPAWKEIALKIPGRKDDQCSKRYCEILDPLAKDRLRDWSPEEDAQLSRLVATLGSSWTAIATKMNGRPALTCRNRWRRLSKKAGAEDIATTQSTSAARIYHFTSLQQMLTASTDAGDESSEAPLVNDFSPTMPSLTGFHPQSPSSSSSSCGVPNSNLPHHLNEVPTSKNVTHSSRGQQTFMPLSSVENQTHILDQLNYTRYDDPSQTELEMDVIVASEVDHDLAVMQTGLHDPTTGPSLSNSTRNMHSTNNATTAQSMVPTLHLPHSIQPDDGLFTNQPNWFPREQLGTDQAANPMRFLPGDTIGSLESWPSNLDAGFSSIHAPSNVDIPSHVYNSGQSICAEIYGCWPPRQVTIRHDVVHHHYHHHIYHTLDHNQ